MSIECFAAVAWEANAPLSVEKVIVEPPAIGQVRIKLTSASLCHTDIGVWAGVFPYLAPFPVLLGHEGAGVVESVGEGVEEFLVGDKVVPCGMPRCGDCYSCKHPRGVGCVNFPTAHHLVNTSQTVSAKGQKLFPLFGLGTFCEYIVVPTTQLAKLSPETCVDQLAPLGCAVLTGWGAAESVAKVTKEDKVAIWGLGAVGLSALMACVKAKAKIVIAVDVDEDKLKTAVKFGATHTLLANKETSNLIRQICESGVDFAFECSGSPKAEDQAIDSLQFGWGLAVLVGCPNTNSSLSIPTNQFIGQGKSIRGIILGGWKNPKEALTRLAEGYSNDRCPDVSGLVTKAVKLEDVNTALESIVKPHNKDLRVLIRFD